jgi:HK97 family phage major capsid protein
MNLTELNGEELQARLDQLTAEVAPEVRDSLSEEDLTSRADEIEAIKAEIENRKNAAAEEARKAEEVAKMQGDPVIKNEREEKKMYDINSKEYRDLWLKARQGTLTEEEERAYSAAGTNAVPTMVSDKFFEKMKKLAPMLSEITLLRVAGNLKFVAEGVRNTADAKHTENSALSAAEDTTVSVTLGGYEFMKVLQISRTAKLMAIDAFENWLIEMLAGDIARSIDDYIINDASNGIAALTYTTGTNQIVNTQGYTYKNVCDLISLLPAAYDAEAKFLTNKKTLWGAGGIAQIVDSAGNPIFVPDTVTGIGGRLLGYPLVVDDYVTNANKALYLGKLTDVVGNLSEDIHVDRDESAGFTSNSIMYRGIAVFDSKPAKGDAIVRLVSTTA